MRLTCLVDNEVRPHSRFRGEHGLAFLVETETGRVLFDTGASGEVLLHNLEVAGIAPEEIDAPALYPNHCTGQTAYVTLVLAFGERFAPVRPAPYWSSNREGR